MAMFSLKILRKDLRTIRAAALLISLPAVLVAGACAQGNAAAGSAGSVGSNDAATTRPNFLFIMSDDHAAHAISAYGSKVNETPHIDRIAREGMLLENCFATNAICGPSRASILTSKYSHLNGVLTHRSPAFDGSQLTYPKLLQKAGYQTAMIGKWHLKSDPTGFDYWNIFPGQGAYHNPTMIKNGKRERHMGKYATDMVTDSSIEFLEQRDKSKPFLLISQHKAPHRPWEPHEKHMHLFEDEDIPLPETFNDDYTSRATPARLAKMRIDGDLFFKDVKSTPPANLSDAERKNWYYQRYMKDYLRCIASVDENVGRLLDYLEKENLLDSTVIVYTSDQGFFLGDHGWYDKRFMYEESLRMPFLVRYPGEIKPGTRSDATIVNVDIAPTFLDYAGIATPEEMQGRSFRQVLAGHTPDDWRDANYFHFHEYPDADHMVARHYGIRTQRYKLIHYYFPTSEWELFDLQRDPNELNNVYADPAYADTVKELKTRLQNLRSEYKDTIGPDVK